MSKLNCLVARGQRAYVASHPLGVWLSIGIAVTGWINVLAPSLSRETSSSIVFDPLILFAFNGIWAVGGSLCVFGLLRGRRKVEGAGMSLLASALATYYLAIIVIRPTAAITAVFILALAIGCAKRAFHLATHGYVSLDVPLDQPGIKG